MAYCQVDAQMSEKYGITRDYYKSKWKILGAQFMREQASGTKKEVSPDFFECQFIIMHMRLP